MNTPFCNSRSKPLRPSSPAASPGAAASRITDHASRFAFTLLEILVSVALLSFIVLGLFAMFNQTQRAFRAGMMQSDILEAGRAVADMIPRDLEQVARSDGYTYNLTAAVIPGFLPLTQLLPGATLPDKLVRTNYLEDVFMLLRDNQTWIGIGYCVRTNDPITGRLWMPVVDASTGQLGAGTLYRFTATLPYLDPAAGPRRGLPLDPSQLYDAFRIAARNGSAASISISNRVCDGVVHFHLRAFATNGFPLYNDLVSTNACFNFVTNAQTPYNLTKWVVRPTLVTPSLVCPDNIAGMYFWSNALPASIELELGLLEPYALDRYNSIGSAAARLAYLQREETSARVHIFRQRIPLRNYDPAAYQ